MLLIRILRSEYRCLAKGVVELGMPHAISVRGLDGCFVVEDADVSVVSIQF